MEKFPCSFKVIYFPQSQWGSPRVCFSGPCGRNVCETEIVLGFSYFVLYVILEKYINYKYKHTDVSGICLLSIRCLYQGGPLLIFTTSLINVLV